MIQNILIGWGKFRVGAKNPNRRKDMLFQLCFGEGGETRFLRSEGRFPGPPPLSVLIPGYIIIIFYMLWDISL